MKLVFFLGNPGEEYKETRHNVGFAVYDAVHEQLSDHELFFFIGREKRRLHELHEYALQTSDGSREKIFCVKPMTYMNNSGVVAAALAKQYIEHLEISKDVWVVHDELALPLGRIKVDRNRTSAGHNGVESIITHLGTKDFIRFRIGIAPTDHPLKGRAEVFVLKRFTKAEVIKLPSVIDRVSHAIITMFSQGFDTARNQYNGK